MIQRESPKIIELAVKLLKSGDLVSIKTETVYGLGGCAFNSNAIRKIYKIKERPFNNPLIIHVNSLEMASEIAELNEDAIKISKCFWPGPLTIILPLKNNNKISEKALSGLGTIAIRIPDSKVFLKIIKKVNEPIAAPSANLSGYISSTKSYHVHQSFGKRIKLIIDSGQSQYGLESSIINLTKKPYEFERIGIIDQETIYNLSKISIREKTFSTKIVAPGQLLRHYSPTTPVRLNAETHNKEEAFLAFGKKFFNLNKYSLNLSPSGNLKEAAFNLFDYLIKLDGLNKTTIAISPIPNYGIGKVINEKLERAAISNG